MRGIDNKGERVVGLEGLDIRLLCVFAFENRGMKNMIFLLCGNISKQAKPLARERFRCQCLASCQYR